MVERYPRAGTRCAGPAPRFNRRFFDLFDHPTDDPLELFWRGDDRSVQFVHVFVAG